MSSSDSSSTPRIGFLDSGVGGLSVWWEAVHRLPQLQTVYLADRLHCPYGPRPPDEVRSLVADAVRTLRERGCTAIVLACNTATAAAVDFLRRSDPSIPYVGMEPAVKPAALRSETGAIGILATAGTYQGRLFRGTAERYAHNVRLVTRDAGGLVPFVDRGELDTPALRAAIERHLAPMREANVDAIVLGCTHFPFLKAAIQAVAGPVIPLIDPAPAVVNQLARVLGLTPSSDTVPSLPPPAEILARFPASAGHVLIDTMPSIRV